MLQRAFYSVGVLLCILLLAACRNEDGEQAFIDAVEINKLGVKSLAVRAVQGGTVLEVGTSSQLRTYATLADGSETDVSDKVRWSSSASSILSVSNGGLAQAGSVDGSANIQVVWASMTANLALSVSSAALVSIDFDNPPNTVSECSAASPYTVMGHYTDRSVEITHLVSTWLSSDEALATISAAGELKALSSGSVTISASYTPSSSATSQTATHVLGINDDLVTLNITPSSAVDIEVLESKQFSAEADDASGSRDVTDVATFVSSDSTVVDFSGAAGLAVAGSKTGSASVSANCGGEQSNVVLTNITQVKAVTGLVIRYQSDASDPLGPFEASDSPLQLQAYLTYSDSSEVEVTSNDDLTWSVVATISGSAATVVDSGASKGEVRFSAVGRTEIRAVYETDDLYQEASVDVLVE